ncbi:MAG: glycosyltransferase family 2 protein [Aquaticitalea sp.]
MNKLVSIIIPVYNAERYLEETLNSVFSQDYKNLEVIAVDDNSTDSSLSILQHITDHRFKLLQQDRKGACAARNLGFENSKGDNIQFLDADDLMSADKIEAQVNALQHRNTSIAVCNTKHFYGSIDQGKITDQEYLFTTSDTKSFLLNLYGANGTPNMVQTSAWLTPRTLIELAGPWDESLSKDQDGEFFCRVVSKASEVIYVPNVLNYYRKHIKGQNIANQKQKTHLESQLKALNSKYEQLKTLKDTNAFKTAFSLQYKWIAIDAYPEFKEISKEAMKKCNVLGGNMYLPVLGGKVIETTKSIFGWRAAKSLSYWVHKIRP